MVKERVRLGKFEVSACESKYLACKPHDGEEASAAVS